MTATSDFGDEFRQFIYRFFVEGNEVRFEQQIFGRITCHSQFRERNNIRPNLLRPLNTFGDLSCIAFNIANRRVDLR